MSDIEKDSITWAKITLVTELTLLTGMLLTTYVFPHEELLKRFTILFISIAVVFVSICSFVVWQIFYLSNKKDKKD